MWRRSRTHKCSKSVIPSCVSQFTLPVAITYKLKLNGGDIKAVQGDTGHAQSKMVSDVYSHILDEGRKHNAQLFEKAFYSEEAEDNTSPAGGSLDVSALQKLLANPEAAALLAALAKSLK